MLGYLSEVSGGVRGLNRMKPGLMFLLRLAWESRTRLPLLIMSGFMALGIRIQLEINIDHAVRLMPRLRMEEEDLPMSEGEDDDDSSDWTSDAGFDSNYDYDYEDDDDEDEEGEEINGLEYEAEEGGQKVTDEKNTKPPAQEKNTTDNT